MAGLNAVVILGVLIVIWSSDLCSCQNVIILAPNFNTSETNETLLEGNELNALSVTEQSVICPNLTDNSNTTTEPNVLCSRNNVTLNSEPETKGSTNVDYVGYIVVPSFLMIAVIGNSLTIRVMISRKFRAKTSSIILIALSVSDTIFSCVVPFNKMFIRNLLGFDIRALSNFGCSLFFIIHKTSKMSSSWFVVFISFERFMAICFPLKTKFICTKRNALIGIASVYICLLIFNGIWDFSTNVINGVCIPNYASPDNALLAKVYLVVGTFVYCLLPAAIMMVLTPITVFQLIRHSQTRRNLSQNANRTDDTAKMTTMLIGVSISFMVLVTPIGICHNVSFALGENIFETKHIGVVIAREILQTMEQLNYSINFLLYVLCSTDFRKKVVQILRLDSLKLPKKKSSSGDGTGDTSAQKRSENKDKKLDKI